MTSVQRDGGVDTGTGLFYAVAIAGAPVEYALQFADSNIAIVHYYSGSPLLAYYGLNGTTGVFDGYTLTVTAVPEPGVVAFGVIAAGSLLGLVARKRKA